MKKTVTILYVLIILLSFSLGYLIGNNNREVVGLNAQEKQLTRQQVYDQLYHLYSQSSKSDSIEEKTTFVLALTACVVGTGTEEVLLETLPTDYLEGMTMYLEQLIRKQSRNEQSGTH